MKLLLNLHVIILILNEFSLPLNKIRNMCITQNKIYPLLDKNV